MFESIKKGLEEAIEYSQGGKGRNDCCSLVYYLFCLNRHNTIDSFTIIMNALVEDIKKLSVVERIELVEEL